MPIAAGISDTSMASASERKRWTARADLMRKRIAEVRAAARRKPPVRELRPARSAQRRAKRGQVSDGIALELPPAQLLDNLPASRVERLLNLVQLHLLVARHRAQGA